MQLDFSYPIVYECSSPTCTFRFPVLTALEAQKARSCPKCGASTQPQSSYSLPRSKSSISAVPHPLHPVEVLVDNVRSAYNVGSIFRIADGAGIRRIHLCGLSPTPHQSSVIKTSLGSEKSVPWNQHLNAKHLAQRLGQQGYHLWALETGGASQSLFSTAFPSPSQPILLIIGNEVSGIDPEVLALSHKYVWIPMSGVKESLNVSTAFSIAAYYCTFRLGSAS